MKMLKIPTIFKNADFSELDKELQEDFKNQAKKGKGIVLFGDSGVGKSYILYAATKFFEETIGKTKEISPCEEYPKGYVASGIEIMFYDVDNLIHKLRNYNSEYDGEVLLNKLTSGESNRSVLFLDDLGVEKTSSFAIEQLTMICNYRYQWCLPTFISTNYIPEEMAEMLGKRIYSRIQGMCKFIPIVGDDKRLKESV